MRSTTVSLALLAAIGTGCSTGSAPRSTTPTGTVGDPAPATSAASGSPREGRAREHLALGRAAMARGDAATAAASFREAIRLQPDLADARENLGLALYEMEPLRSR